MNLCPALTGAKQLLNKVLTGCIKDTQFQEENHSHFRAFLIKMCKDFKFLFQILDLKSLEIPQNGNIFLQM